MADKKYKEFKHITLNQNDIGLLACPKTHLCRNNSKMYAKLRLAVDSVNFMNMGLMNEDQISSFMEGGAVMYHLMTNLELLKDCKNIYEQHESEKNMNSKREEYLTVNEMMEETLQIGENGADIEMHIMKNKVGIYFVSFERFIINSDKMRVPYSDELHPAYPYKTKEAIYEAFGDMMCGKTISI